MSAASATSLYILTIVQIFILLIFVVEKKIDGLCLMEGLSDEELMSYENVKTVGDKRKVKRKISELLGK